MRAARRAKSAVLLAPKNIRMVGNNGHGADRAFYEHTS
jgi:hypothetical protein